MAPKTIRSQYHSTCRVCEKHIRPGDMISWARGEKPAHIECVEQPAAQPQQPTLQQLTRERDALASDGQNLRRMIGERDATIQQLRGAVERLARERDELHDECVKHWLTRDNGRCECITAAPVAEIHAEESGSIETDCPI